MRWTDVEEIVEALEDLYPKTDIENIRFTQLHQLVVDLIDFNDDPNRSNEKTLEAIQSKWLELRDGEFDDEELEDEEFEDEEKWDNDEEEDD